jgi:Leucine-rich repeat (LRR) protein
MCNQKLVKLGAMEGLVNLRWAAFNNNLITKIEGLDKCKKLEELSLEGNLLQSLEGLENCENLRKLNVNNNLIYYHEENTKRDASQPANWELNLGRLTYLSISYNKLKSLKFVSKLTSIIELYASFNKIKNLRDVFHLKQLNSLIILDLWSNDMCEDVKYRTFVIYNLRFLKSLDGFSIDQNEYLEAKEAFGGKLTCDFIAEKFPSVRLNEIKNLEFPQCSIRSVDLGPTPQMVADQFENLRALNLENNSLVSFSGLIYLRNLRVLCLNYNKIESVFPRSKNNPNPNYDGQILPSLEILHLAYNGISDLVGLQIGRLSSLKALFLQGNELTKIEGLEGLRDLRELVLDKNKIKSISENSFVDQAQRLVELHIEENRLRDLNNIEILQNLQKVYAANNKITEFTDIEPLTELNNIQEISLINNPVRVLSKNIS